MLVPSLLALCTAATARVLLSSGAAGGYDLHHVPDELALEVWAQYSRLASPGYVRARPGEHLGILMLFAHLWHPEALALEACDAPPRPESLAHLALVGDQLRHLSLAALPGLPGPLAWAAALPQLTCLSLRRNQRLTGADLAPLAACTRLRALDLAYGTHIGDEAGPALMHLPWLEVLDVTGTAVGDATLEALTYVDRLHAWSRQHAQRLPADPAGRQRSRLRRLHLAHSRVTGAAAKQLLALASLDFLDMRGSGVAAAQLRPLQQRFCLTAVQGGVLARSAAAAAAVPYAGHDFPVFLCVCASPPGLHREGMEGGLPGEQTCRQWLRQVWAAKQAAPGMPAAPAGWGGTHHGA